MRAPIEATAGSLRILIRLVVVSLEVVRYEYSCGCGELEGLCETSGGFYTYPRDSAIVQGIALVEDGLFLVVKPEICVYV